MDLSLLQLSYVKRWIVAPVHREQSVAEHTFRVIALAEALWLAHSTYTVPVELYRRALYHDADECLTGDIPGPAKDRSSVHFAEEDASRWKTRDHIGCVVKVADALETAMWWLTWGNVMAWKDHPYNEVPKRDIQVIVHYGGQHPGLLDAARQAWKSQMGIGGF